MKVILHIESSYESKIVELTDELTIGRTDQAQLTLDDAGLSRVNCTFFIDGSDVLLADENSTNGTFLNGQQITGRARELSNGDQVKIGHGTNIRVEIVGGNAAQNSRQKSPPPADSVVTPPPIISAADIKENGSAVDEEKSPPYLLIAAGAMTLLIVAFGAVAIFVVPRITSNSTAPGGKPTVAGSSAIPVRVIDPLGGEDLDNLDDLVASWETAEDELNVGSVADVTVASSDKEEEELAVTAAFLAEQQKKAMEPRPGETGIRPAGLKVLPELFGDGVIKQKAKIKIMNQAGYRQPMDFADLARMRMNRELIELPMATNSFFLDVGGSAKDIPFESFTFEEGKQPLLVGSPKYGELSKLAQNFAGQKYDLNNPADRKQMRMRLLRMFNPHAKPILKELSEAYFQKFGRPLRVTSLTRSMDYQILLNSGNANSFKVSGAGALPPHTSGCAFDLARKHMPADEQNFVIAKLAEMERAGKVDALIEYGVNACFHVFIYDDGVPPKM